MTVIERITDNTATGTPASTGNVAGAQQVFPGTGGTITWQSGSGRGGMTGLQFTVASGQTNLVRFNLAAASNQLQKTGWWKAPASFPTADAIICSGRHSSGVAFRIIYSTTGALYLQDSAGTNTPILAAGNIVAGAWHVIEYVAVGASTTAGSITLKVYDEYGTQIGSTFAKSNANFTANNFFAIDTGSGTGATTFSWFGVRANDGSGTALAPYGGFATPATLTTSGDGALSFVGTPTTSSGLNTSGTGSATLTGAPTTAAALAASGAGTTTLAGTPSTTATLATNGAGTAGLTGSPGTTATLTTSGTGTPTFATSGTATDTLNTNGTGTLTLTGTPRLTGALATSGSGTAALTASGSSSGPLATSGSGQVTYTGRPAVGGVLTVSGSGTVAFVVTPPAGYPPIPDRRTLLPAASRTLTSTMTRTLTQASTDRTLERA